MPAYGCLIQEGQAAHERQEARAEGLRRLGAEAFADDPSRTDVTRIVLPNGEGDARHIQEVRISIGCRSSHRLMMLKRIMAASIGS